MAQLGLWHFWAGRHCCASASAASVTVSWWCLAAQRSRDEVNGKCGLHVQGWKDSASSWFGAINPYRVHGAMFLTHSTAFKLPCTLSCRAVALLLTCFLFCLWFWMLCIHMFVICLHSYHCVNSSFKSPDNFALILMCIQFLVIFIIVVILIIIVGKLTQLTFHLP